MRCYCYSFSFQITIVETIRYKRNLDADDDDHDLSLFNCSISLLKKQLYKYIGVFLLGTASCQFLTDIGKYSIGRFRPHFITVSRFDVFIIYEL